VTVDATEPHSSVSEVEPKVVLGSMFALWGFYFVIATLRSVIDDHAYAPSMLAPRLAASLVSVGLTSMLYLTLRPIVLRSLSASIATAIFACLPAALAYGTTNWLMFERVFPAIGAFLSEWLQANVRSSPTAPSDVVVGAASAPASGSVFGAILSTSLNGYFFVVSWCALYAALSYAARIRQLERRSARLQAAAQSSELRALRYQVNPHFLFNTLNSLSSLVMADRKSDAELMLVQLATFFRAAL
jgi:two-component system LytT family sensor kinase